MWIRKKSRWKRVRRNLQKYNMRRRNDLFPRNISRIEKEVDEEDRRMNRRKDMEALGALEEINTDA